MKIYYLFFLIMKNSALLLIFVFCSLNYTHAQGLIVAYEEISTISLQQLDFSQIDNPRIRAAIENSIRERMNNERSKTAQLIVNNGISLYKTEEFEQPESAKVAGWEGNTYMSGTIIQRSGSSTLVIYKNYLDKLMLSQSKLEGKEYLIEEPLTEIKWKIGRKKREISGFHCIEATTKTSTGTPVVAWYTPDIPVSDGPLSYWGLPGLILYMDINNGGRVISCTSVEPVDDLPAIETPTEGERVSRKQFNKMREDWMQRIQNNARLERGGNSTIITGGTVIR